LAPLLVAHALAWRRQAFSAPAVALLGAAGAASATAFVVTNPFAVLDWQTFLTTFRAQSLTGSVPWAGQSSDPTWQLYLLTLVQARGGLQLLLAGIGLGALLLRDRRDLLLLGSFPLIYLAFMLRESLFGVRYALPLTPFLSVFAAVGGIVLAAKLATVVRQPTGVVALAALAILQPGLAIVQHNLLIMRDDTRVLAYRWALDHLAGQGPLVGEYTTFVEQWTYVGATPMKVEQVAQAFSLDFDAYRQASYTLVATSSFDEDMLWMPSTDQWEDLIPGLYGAAPSDKIELSIERERVAEFVQTHNPIATFTPGVDGSSIPFQLDDAYTPFWDLSAWVRPGPTIRIYALDK
jgi:hypothetical protein